MSIVVDDLAAVEPGPSAVTIGVFDGVHVGHRAIVGRAVERARAADVRGVVVTFDPHPARVVRPSAAPPLLQRLEDRVACLGDAGADLVLVLPFTQRLAELPPQAFHDQVLQGPLRARAVVVGENFRFGRGAAGDVATLAALGRDHGCDVEAVGLHEVQGATVSSTRVRARLAAGDVAFVTEALGRPWEHVGTVVEGDRRGRTIGFPTANVAPSPGFALPGNGVYTARVRRDDDRWDAVVNVGTRPTFDGTTTTVEAHLLDADVDLYGQRLHVAFHDRLRDERRFDGPDELVAQLRRDVERGRELLARR